MAASSIGIGSTVAEIAEFLGVSFRGCGTRPITGLNGLEAATADELSFLHVAKWASRLAETEAGAVLVTRGVEVPPVDPEQRAILEVDDAEIAMLRVLEAFSEDATTAIVPGIDASAIIDATAVLGDEVAIGPHVSIGANARIGEGCTLHAGVRIARDVEIGAGSTLHANVVIESGCRVGRGCRFHPGVVIGADGFGYRPAPDGSGLLKVPHLGYVDIGHDVEIGASSCVDRGKFGATSIGDNTKIDNLVQIAHNVIIGRSTVIAAQVGLAGSARVGDGVQIGAQAGLVEHIVVGDGARIGAKAGVIKDVPAGEAVAGIPAQPARDTLRQVSALRRLPEYLARQGRTRGGDWTVLSGAADTVRRPHDPRC